MATIFGVDCGSWALPENDSRSQNDSLGQAASGAVKGLKFRASDRMVTIILKGKSTTIKNNLGAALEGATARAGQLVPESWIDAGAGVNTTANVVWVDKQFNAVKDNHEFWNITVNFMVTV
jgi:hypothetical protein